MSDKRPTPRSQRIKEAAASASSLAQAPQQVQFIEEKGAVLLVGTEAPIQTLYHHLVENSSAFPILFLENFESTVISATSPTRPLILIVHYTLFSQLRNEDQTALLRADAPGLILLHAKKEVAEAEAWLSKGVQSCIEEDAANDWQWATLLRQLCLRQEGRRRREQEFKQGPTHLILRTLPHAHWQIKEDGQLVRLDNGATLPLESPHLYSLENNIRAWLAKTASQAKLSPPTSDNWIRWKNGRNEHFFLPFVETFDQNAAVPLSILLIDVSKLAVQINTYAEIISLFDHDLRSPLTSLMMSARIAQENAVEDPHAELWQIVYESAQQINELSSELFKNRPSL